MSYNFKIKSKSTQIVGDKNGVFVEIPIYADLLGGEYEVQEELEKEEAKYNQQVINLAARIAADLDKSPWAVVNMLNNWRDYTETFSPYLTKLAELETMKPSDIKRSQRIVLAMLQSRVSDEITLEDVKSFPKSFLRQLHDLFYQEQMGASGRPYADIYAENAVLTERLTKTVSIVDAATEVYNSYKNSNNFVNVPENEALDNLVAAIEMFVKENEEAGK